MLSFSLAVISVALYILIYYSIGRPRPQVNEEGKETGLITCSPNMILSRLGLRICELYNERTETITKEFNDDIIHLNSSVAEQGDGKQKLKVMREANKRKGKNFYKSFFVCHVCTFPHFYNLFICLPTFILHILSVGLVYPFYHYVLIYFLGFSLGFIGLVLLWDKVNKDIKNLK